MGDTPDSITELYRAVRSGDQAAKNRLFTLLYEEICDRASKLLAQERLATGTTGDLAHEAYVRLAGAFPEVNDRQHLMRLITSVMRHICIEWARKRLALRRNAPVLQLDTKNLHIAHQFQLKAGHLRTPEEILLVDRGLTALAEIDPAAAEVLGLKHFGGFTVEEIASQLGLSKTAAQGRLTVASGKLARILGRRRSPS